MSLRKGRFSPLNWQSLHCNLNFSLHPLFHNCSEVNRVCLVGFHVNNMQDDRDRYKIKRHIQKSIAFHCLIKWFVLVWTVGVFKKSTMYQVSYCLEWYIIRFCFYDKYVTSCNFGFTFIVENKHSRLTCANTSTFIRLLEHRAGEHETSLSGQYR